MSISTLNVGGDIGSERVDNLEVRGGFELDLLSALI